MEEKTATAAEKADQTTVGNGSKPRTSGGLGEKLLSRANTMLKAATLSRDNSKPGTAQIKDTVKTLQREKTKLAITTEEDDGLDDDMRAYLNKMKQEKSEKELNDSDFDTDLEDEAPTITSDWSPTTLYKKTCKKLGQRTVPFVEKGLETKEVKVVNRCLNSLDVLSITNALISNQTVTRLTLDGNDIRDEGAQLIAWLMKDQESFIEKLSIADNDIGPEGFQAIAEMLQESRQITSLNISGNRAGDEEIKTLAVALKTNHQLQNLNLSFNNVSDRAAKYLASAIAQNEGLTTLDLSWNKIRPSGGVAICHALKENVILKSLNLSMNGLSTAGSYYIKEALQKNDTLTYLDITFNRIYDEGAAHIAKGLEKNTKLHHLIMHHNPLTSAGAMAMLAAIRSNENTAMWKLDLSSVPVLKDVATAYEEYYAKNDGFTFLHGLLLDSEPRLEGDMHGFSHRNPMAMVKDYIEEEGLRLMDFFKLMDKDHGGTISREEFVEGLQRANVPMSQAQIDDLIETLDRDGDGEIDYRELVDGDRDFRRKRLRMKLAALEAMRQALRNPNPEDSWMKI